MERLEKYQVWFRLVWISPKGFITEVIKIMLALGVLICIFYGALMKIEKTNNGKSVINGWEKYGLLPRLFEQ